MAGPDPAVAALRSAVRPGLAADAAPVLVACSGGADSLALAAAVAFEAPRAGVPAGAVTVDHGLQPGSDERAARTAELLEKLGLAPVEIARVDVGADGGPEAAARAARYTALERAAIAHGARIALGHTLDDQAETVLLGLGRGSGPRSVAGMVAQRVIDGVAGAQVTWWRPLLGVRRTTTRAACAAQGLPVWEDPWNTDPAYTRARLRAEVLPLMDDVLGGGVAPALARTAAMLREDLDALDALAVDDLRRLVGADGTLPAETLAARPAAVRRRVLRGWLLAAGAADLQAVHLDAVDALLTRWHGQGPVDLPGRVAVVRASGRLGVRPPGVRGGPPPGPTASPQPATEEPRSRE